MAEWTSSNIYITEEGQRIINQVSYGCGKMQITDVYSSSQYGDDGISQATDLTMRMQKLSDPIFSKAPSDETSFVLQAQLHNKAPVEGAITTYIEGTGGYYLRQIGIYGHLITNEGIENEDVLIFIAEPVAGTEDFIPVTTDASVVLTYAFQLNLFKDVGNKITVKVSMDNAGMVSNVTYQDDKDKNFTNPVFNGVMNLSEGLITANQNGDLFSCELTEYTLFGDVDNPVNALVAALPVGAVTNGDGVKENSQLKIKVNVPRNGNYILRFLVVDGERFDSDKCFVVYNYINNEEVTLQRAAEDELVNYSDGEDKLNIITATVFMEEGLNIIGYKLWDSSAKTTEIEAPAFVSLNVSNDVLKSLSSFSVNIPAEMVNETVANPYEDKAKTLNIKDTLFTPYCGDFININDELLIFFPLYKYTRILNMDDYDTIDGVLNNHEERIASNEELLINHEERISANEGTLDNHEVRITSNESTLSNHESRISANESKLSNHESRITVNEKTLADYGDRFEEDEGILSDHEDRITNNEEYKIYRGSTGTHQSTQTKKVDCADFPNELKLGMRIYVTFPYGNNSTSMKLNVNETGAKNVYFPEGESLTLGGSSNPVFSNWTIPKRGVAEFIYGETGGGSTGWIYVGNSIAPLNNSVSYSKLDFDMQVKLDTYGKDIENNQKRIVEISDAIFTSGEGDAVSMSSLTTFSVLSNLPLNKEFLLYNDYKDTDGIQCPSVPVDDEGSELSFSALVRQGRYYIVKLDKYPHKMNGAKMTVISVADRVNDLNTDIEKVKNNVIKISNEGNGFSAGKDSGVTAISGNDGTNYSELSGGAIGYGAKTKSGGAAGKNAITVCGGAMGEGAESFCGGAMGLNAVSTLDGGAMGYGAFAYDGGAIGSHAKSGDGFSGGSNAKVKNNGTDENPNYIDAIQLGRGTNNDAGTLQIYSYPLLDANGNVPLARIAKALDKKIVYYAVCNEAYNVVAKTVTCEDFPSTLTEGTRIHITFPLGHKKSTMTLSVNGGAAVDVYFPVGNSLTKDIKNVMDYGSTGIIASRGIAEFIYSAVGQTTKAWVLTGTSIVPPDKSITNAKLADEVNNRIKENEKFKIYYGVCDDTHGHVNKYVSCSEFGSADLVEGARIEVVFANGNSSEYMTLNVNGTGDKFAYFPIDGGRAYNDPMIARYIIGGVPYEFVYMSGTPDGSGGWVCCSSSINYLVGGDGKIPLDRLITDTTPTVNSSHLITSGGVYTALNERMKIGDLASNVDFNNVTSPGIYQVRWADGNNYVSLHRPTSNGGTLQVHQRKDSANTLYQIWQPDCINESYARFKSAGTWDAWQKRVYTDTTYADATLDSAGLMSSTDKRELADLVIKSEVTNLSLLTYNEVEVSSISTYTYYGSKSLDLNISGNLSPTRLNKLKINYQMFVNGQTALMYYMSSEINSCNSLRICQNDGSYTVHLNSVSSDLSGLMSGNLVVYYSEHTKMVLVESGYPLLDANGKIPHARLPFFGDDNEVNDENTGNLIVGIGNTLFSPNNYSHSQVVIGRDNVIPHGSCNLIVGRDTDITGTSTDILIGGISNEGYGVCASVFGYHNKFGQYNHVVGRYSDLGDYSDSGESSGTKGYAFVVGIGDSTARKNGLTVSYKGVVDASSSMTATGADVAEYYEWADGNPDGEDRVGHFVVVDLDGKVRFANENDDIDNPSFLRRLGIVSGRPGLIGNNAPEHWSKKYLTDVYDRFLTEHKVYEALYNEDGELEREAYEADEFILNPEFDDTQSYTPRENRREWDCISRHGQLTVIDDGTCEVGGYCKPIEGGIATSSETGLFVMKRFDNKHIFVLI